MAMDMARVTAPETAETGPKTVPDTVRETAACRYPQHRTPRLLDCRTWDLWGEAVLAGLAVAVLPKKNGPPYQRPI